MRQSPINVLVVEDNPADVELVRAVLAEAGEGKFYVLAAASLRAAIERARSEHADLLLLDLGLPDSQGLETFLRAHSALSDIPILVLSGLCDEEIAIQAVQQGAQDYLLKGVAMEEVLPRAIRYALERHRSQVQLAGYTTELRTKNALLEEELRMAREIQQALIPGQYPQFLNLSGLDEGALQFAHCYRPASGLSGDFFNVLHLPDNKVGLLICDVMGHGVRAALIGALARGLFDQLRPVAADPGKFLSGLNQGLGAILRQAGIESFASAFYTVTDLATRAVRYSSAGHPDAVVLRRDRGLVDWLRTGAPHHPPLGLIADTVYRVSESALSMHDSLLLFTDGVYEEENAAGEQFGRQRLRDAVNRRLRQPSETLLNDLVHDIQDFSGHEEFADDVCMVGMDVIDGHPSIAKAA